MKIVSLFFIFLISQQICSANEQIELKRLKNELQKIENLRNSGNSTDELDNYYKNLQGQIQTLENKVPPKKKTVRKKKLPPVIRRRKKRVETIYKLDRALSIREQYEKAQEDLKLEETTLENLQKSFKNGASYLENAISKTQQKISSIKRELNQLKNQNSQLKDDSKIDLKTGMMLDAYYMYNLNSPSGGSKTSLRNYDQSHNDFTVNLVEFNFTGSYRDYGFYVDLDYGEFANQNSTDAVSTNIGQAYLTFEENGYLFTFGKMYTNVGYEVAKSQENWNYSRSFAFTNAGPFWHEGITLTKSYDNGFGWGLYIYDRWDTRTENNNDKSYSAQLNYSTDKFSIVYNYITGAEGTGASNKSNVHETNMQYNINDNFALAFNAVFRTDENTGSVSGTTLRDRKRTAYVGYLNFKSQRWTFTPRLEFFTDENSTETLLNGSALTKNDLEFTAITFTSSYAFRPNTELRLEVRNDNANQKFYIQDGKAKKDQTTASLAWLMSY